MRRGAAETKVWVDCADEHVNELSAGSNAGTLIRRESRCEWGSTWSWWLYSLLSLRESPAEFCIHSEESSPVGGRSSQRFMNAKALRCRSLSTSLQRVEALLSGIDLTEALVPRQNAIKQLRFTLSGGHFSPTTVRSRSQVCSNSIPARFSALLAPRDGGQHDGSKHTSRILG